MGGAEFDRGENGVVDYDLLWGKSCAHFVDFNNISAGSERSRGIKLTKRVGFHGSGGNAVTRDDLDDGIFDYFAILIDYGTSDNVGSFGRGGEVDLFWCTRVPVFPSSRGVRGGLGIAMGADFGNCRLAS